ncbi:Fusaric acid resistance protein-like [Demequina mangrovi]|uniref:Fusaric acid resistance protein-like n=2 Tax=Demequina mangrovi TaxID=1043493 RepID=A0A1H6W8W0_9MICO|nr:Fusaric acid resistance protein-like [Demequina mangrovi]
MRRAVVSLGTIVPAKEPRWPIALQASVVLTVPILVGIAFDRVDLGLIAATGAFTVPYFAALPRLERLRLRPIAGLVLVLTSAVGALLAPYGMLSALGLVVVTILVGIAVHGYRLGPPGPLFPVLVYGMSGHAVDGGLPALTLVATVAAGCTWAVIASIAPLIRRVHWQVKPRPLSVLLARPAWDRGAKELVWRTVIVTVLGTALSLLWVDPDRAYWTVAAGVVVVGVVPGRGPAVTRGLHRAIGTVVGVGIYLAISQSGMPALALAFTLGALQYVTELAITRHYAIAVAAVTPMALVIVTASAGQLGDLAVTGERILDTVVGSALAVATALLHPPAPPDPAGRHAPPHRDVPSPGT